MTGNKKTVAILNFAPVYRKSIYLLMEDKLGCHFYFGDRTLADVKKLDYSHFSKKVNEMKFVRLFKNFNWLSGSVILPFKPYTNYILTGEPYCISSWFVLILNKILGKKSIVWTHGWYGNEGTIKTWVKRWYFGLTDVILLYGEYAKRKMIEVGFADKKLHVIYNSLDYELQTQFFSQSLRDDIYLRYFGNNDPVVIFIGRITHQKKLEELLEAQQLGLKSENKFNVVLVGGGPALEDLKNDASLREASVWFYGPCYEESKIASLLYNADVCVSPGNVGLTAIHAMSYGLPVITHNKFTLQMPEFEAIIPNITGAFFEKGNISDLSSIISQFLQNNTNRKLVRVRCREVIDNKYNPFAQLEVIKSVLD